jgi:hypothetical protein
MAFYETFNLTIDNEIIDPSGYAQGDIQTTYAGTATTITQTHIVDRYKILIEFIDTFADYIDLYLEGTKVISSRAVYGKQGFVTQFYGAKADSTDYPLAQHIVSKYNTGDTSPDTVAFVGESAGFGISGFGDTNAIGVKGVAMSLINTGGGYENNAVGLYGKALRDPTTANAALCIGVYGNATHLGAGAGATNTAFYANATSATTNYSFYGAAGEMYNLGNVNFAAVCAADTFRLASGKYIGYSAAVGTAPTGGLSFNTSNNATFTGSVTTGSNILVSGSVFITGTGTDGIIYGRRINAGSTAVTSNQTISVYYSGAYNGTGYNYNGYTAFRATENQTTIAAGTRFEIATTANGSTTVAVKWYVDQDGHIKPNSNNAYDLATSALKIRQAHVTAYYNYRTVDNETASHYLYETGSDSVIRRKTIANVRTELLQNSPDANLATSSQRGLMSASDALILEQNDLTENLVTQDNGLAHKMRNFSGGALAKGDVVMIAPNGTAVQEAGDTDNLFFAWSISGVTKDNSDYGKLYYKVSTSWFAGGSEHETVEVTLYKGTETSGNIVAQYTNSGVPAGILTVSFTESNSSGIVASCKLDLPTSSVVYAYNAGRYVAPPTPFDVISATANTTESIGIVYSDSSNNLDEVLVATTGIAYVKFKTGITPLAGDWAYMSDTSGRAARDTAPSTTFATWLKNIGKVLETGTSGGLAKVRLGA